MAGVSYRRSMWLLCGDLRPGFDVFVHVEQLVYLVGVDHIKAILILEQSSPALLCSKGLLLLCLGSGTTGCLGVRSSLVVSLHLGSPGTESMDSSRLSTRPSHTWRPPPAVSCRLCPPEMTLRGPRKHKSVSKILNNPTLTWRE